MTWASAHSIPVMGRQRFWDVLSMQWRLYRGRRSTWLIPLAAVAATWPLSAVYTTIATFDEAEGSIAARELLEVASTSSSLVQLLALFSGVALSTAHRGSARPPTSSLVVPRRWLVVSADLAIALLLWVPSGIFAASGAPLSVALMSGKATVDAVTPDALVLLLSAGIAAGLAAVLGSALGIALRSPLWAAAVGFLVFSLLPMVLAGMDAQWLVLPGPAINRTVTTTWDLSVPLNVAAAVGWTALACLIALVVAEQES